MTRVRSPLFPTIAPVILLVGFSLFWFSDTIADPDLWGHLRFGQDIIRTRTVPAPDIYSYRTSGQPWINHEWLAEVIFAALYDWGGPASLVVFKVLLSVSLMVLSLAHLGRRGACAYAALTFLVLVAIPFRLGLGTVRPQVFTYLFFFLELLILEKSGTTGSRKPWFIPVLFAIWVNLHGGVLAGVGVLGIWIVVRLIENVRHDSTRASQPIRAPVQLGLLAVASAAALVLNPYGAELIRFLLRTATVARPEIGEWVPLALASLPGQIYLLLLLAGAIGLIGSRRARGPEAIAIFVVTAALPMVSNRHYPLFALALIVLTGEHIADVWNQWERPKWLRPRAGRRLGVASVVVAAILIIFSIPRLGCIRVEPFYFGFPARAVAFLKATRVAGNMAVPFDWGEYVLWHVGPAIKVSMDGRRETIYSDLAYQQSRDFERGSGVWNALLTTSPTDLVLTHNGSPSSNLLGLNPGWVPLYRDSFCILFMRARFADIEGLAQSRVPDLPDDGARLCFPAPGSAHKPGL